MPPEVVVDEEGRWCANLVYGPGGPYPHQTELHASNAHNLLAIGGWGSGKSAFLVAEALNVVFEYPGADVLLLRRNWKELEKGLILDWQNMVPPQLYRYNKQEHVATILSPDAQGHVFFGHLQNNSERDLAQYLSSAFVFIGVDEIGQFSYQAYSFLYGRLRVNKSCLPNAQGYMPVPRFGAATNPMGPGYGWIKDLWIDKKPPSQIEEAKKRTDGKFYDSKGICVYDPDDFHYVHSTILDNPAQLEKDPEYISKLEKLPPALRSKALDGDLNSVAGSYFGNFSWDRNVRSLIRDRENMLFEDWQPCWLSMDWGLAHYTSIYWHTLAKIRDMEGKWKQVCVTYREKLVHDMTVTQVCDVLDDLTPKHDEGQTIKRERQRLKYLFLSPDRFKRDEYKHIVAHDMSDYLSSKGLPRCFEAADARVDGATFLYGMIETGDWIILDNCPVLIRSIETRIRNEKNLEDVLKTDDDLDDAYDGARYGVFSMLRDKAKPAEVKFQERLDKILDPVARTVYLYQDYLKKQNQTGKKIRIVPRWQMVNK